LTLARRFFIVAGAAATAAAWRPRIARAAPDRLAHDFAYYNPVSLILK
jgi:hypothetical protein